MRRRSGFSILEIMIAIAILAVLLIAIIPAFTGFLRTNKSSEERTVAITLAQERLEALRLQDPRTLPSSGFTETVVSRNGKAYRVRTLYCTNAALCNSVTRQIVVRVEQGSGRKVIYEVGTVFTKLH